MGRAQLRGDAGEDGRDDEDETVQDHQDTGEAPEALGPARACGSGVLLVGRVEEGLVEATPGPGGPAQKHLPGAPFRRAQHADTDDDQDRGEGHEGPEQGSFGFGRAMKCDLGADVGDDGSRGHQREADAAEDPFEESHAGGAQRGVVVRARREPVQY